MTPRDRKVKAGRERSKAWCTVLSHTVYYLIDHRNSLSKRHEKLMTFLKRLAWLAIYMPPWCHPIIFVGQVHRAH
jgi:hypothetical protein